VLPSKKARINENLSSWDNMTFVKRKSRLEMEKEAMQKV